MLKLFPGAQRNVKRKKIKKSVFIVLQDTSDASTSDAFSKKNSKKNCVDRDSNRRQRDETFF